MKKKLIVATALILIAAFSLALLAGCDEIFKRNDKRDMTQIVATVKYEGQTANVYKYELAASFNNYAYLYVNYYGMTYEAAADYVLQSLAQQKLLVLYAKAKVAERLGVPVPNDFSGLFNNAEKDHAIDEANESLLSSLKQLMTDAITEDNYNNADTSTSKPDDGDDDDDEQVTDGVNVRFEANGGSEVEKQRIQKGSKAKEPEEPTRDGYTFYGWHKANLDDHGALQKGDDGYLFVEEEFDFEETAIDESLTLVAEWRKYTAPRTAMPQEEEEDEHADYDPDKEISESEISKGFFTTEYYSSLYNELKDEDFVENINVPERSSLEKELKSYIDEGLETLRANLAKNIFAETDEARFNYYLNSQYESLIVDKLQRLIGKEVEAGFDKATADAEIQKEFENAVRQNKETFAGSDTAYSSALTSSLNTTYFHPNVADGTYGFVINILLRLDDDNLKTLTDMFTANPSEDGKKAVEIMRNRLLSEIKVKVSNPAYDASETFEDLEDGEGNKIELRDPMTDKRNPYGYFGAEDDSYDHSYQYNSAAEGEDPVYANDYQNILNFVATKDEDTNKYTYSIEYHATEHPGMAYLLKSVPAFDYEEDGTMKKGIIHQIYDSFEQVKNAEGMTPQSAVYWLRQVATKWAYLVGDDTGAVTSSSNNNGLGYLISPEGESSNYLKDFTTYARQLVKKGAGAYADDSKGAIDDAAGSVDFAKADSQGNFAGNNRTFVVADSFLNSGSTSNAYTGVFVLLNTYTVWDSAFYKEYTKSKDVPDGNDLALTGDDGILPLDYVIDLAENEEDIKTLRDIIYDSLLESKKTDAYNLEVNSMGSEYANGIQYNRKAYKSLWKDLD